jgi:hypothetical protein
VPSSPTPIAIAGHTSRPVKGNVLADEDASFAADPVVVVVVVVLVVVALATFAVGLDPEAVDPEPVVWAELVAGGGVEDVVE